MKELRYVEVDPSDGSIQAIMESAYVQNDDASLDYLKPLVEARGRRLIVLGPDDPLPRPFAHVWDKATESFVENKT